MHRTPTQHRRGASFTPLAQNDTADDSAPPPEVLTSKERFRNQVQHVLRHASTIEEEDEEEEEEGGIQDTRQGSYSKPHQAQYAPVGGYIIPNIEFEEVDIAELPTNTHIEYYGSGYERAPSSLSKASDVRTETTYVGSDHGDKYTYYTPRVTSSEVHEKIDIDAVRKSLPDYKPFVLKHWFLLPLLLTVGILLSLMVLALRILPDGTPSITSIPIPTTQNSTQNSTLDGTLTKPNARGQSARRVEPVVLFARRESATDQGSSAADVTTPAVADDAVTTKEPESTKAKESAGSSAPSEPSSGAASLERSITSDPTTPDTPSTTSRAPPAPTLTTAAATTTLDNIPTPTTAAAATTTTLEDTPTSAASSEVVISTTSAPEVRHSSTEIPTEDPVTSSTTSHIDIVIPSSTEIISTTSAQPTSSEQVSSTSPSQPDPPTSVTIITVASTTSETSPTTTTTRETDNFTPTSSSPQDPGSTLSQTSARSLRTCTVFATDTQTEWITIPVITVNLGLGLRKKTAAPVATMIPRQDLECDETVTVTVVVTAFATTAETTVTIGIGNTPTSSAATSEQGSPTQSPPATSQTSASPSNPGDPTLTLPTLSLSIPGDPTLTLPTPTISVPQGPTQSDPTSTQTTLSLSIPVGPTGTDTTTVITETLLPTSSSTIIVITNIVSSDTSVTSATSVTETTATSQTVVVTQSDTMQSTTSQTGSPPTSTTSSSTLSSYLPSSGTVTPSSGTTVSTTTQSATTPVIVVTETHTEVYTSVYTVHTNTTTTSITTNESGSSITRIIITSIDVTKTSWSTQEVVRVKTSTDEVSQVTVTTTLLGPDGVATATQTQLWYGHMVTTTLLDSSGRPTKTETQFKLSSLATTVVTDSHGRLSTKSYLVVPSETTLTDRFGRPTSTQTMQVTETPLVTTLFNSDGVATLTETIMVPEATTTSVVIVSPSGVANASALAQTVEPIPISSQQYFTGMMLPTLLAVALSVPVRILDQTAKLYQPFSALTAKYGAKPADSLCLQTTGMLGLLSGILAPLTGNVVLAVTGLLALTSALVVALSSEAVRMVVKESACSSSDNGALLTCPMTIGVQLGPARAVVGLLALMALLIGAAAFALHGRRTGIWNNRPWSLFDMSRLATNTSVSGLVKRLRPKDGSIRNKDAIANFGDRRFGLGFWKEHGWDQYGVMVMNDAGGWKKERRSVDFAKAGAWKPRRRVMPFFALSLAGRALFLLLLLSLLLVVLLYNNTGGDAGHAFQQFMDRESFGGRFLLTVVGVIISFIWWTWFTSVAFTSPYRLLCRRQAIPDAIYLSPPSNPFSGLWRTATRQHPDLYLGVVALTAILSDFLPALLANVSYKVVQTSGANMICTWTAVFILCVMFMVVIWSFLISWPHMPIDPSTLAGAMYYVSDPKTFPKGKATSSAGGMSSSA